MNRAELNYWVDITMLAAFLAVGITGVIKFFFFMNGIRLGLDVHVVNEIHDWSGIALVIAALLHLILHFNWLWSMTKRKVARSK
jgi:hypothetical protein